jgi:hypothetical protein
MLMDPANVGTWVLVAIALMPAIETLRRWFVGEKRKIGPQPFEVRAAPNYAPVDHTHTDHVTRTDLSRVVEAVESLGQRVDSRFGALEKSAEARSSALHNRINPIAEGVAALRARFEDHLSNHGGN